jgi:hypothetical protein
MKIRHGLRPGRTLMTSFSEREPPGPIVGASFLSQFRGAAHLSNSCRYVQLRAFSNSVSPPVSGKIRAGTPIAVAPAGNIRDDQRIRCNYSAVTYAHSANNGRVASDDAVVAYGSSAGSRPRSNGTYLVNYAVSSDLGVAVHSESNMRNEQTRADLSVRMNVGMGHHCKELVQAPSVRRMGSQTHRGRRR